MPLNDKHLELLTAFVDGELTGRERKEALRLMNRSSEARTVLRDLQENAHRLRSLPRHELGPQFAGEIVSIIQKRTIRPRQAGGLPYGRRWLKFAAVAACLLALAGTAYLF